MEKHFGKMAGELLKRAQGLDDRPVADYEGIKSVSNEVTFFEDVNDKKKILGTIKHLSEKVGLRLRKKGLSGKTVRIKIRWPDFETHTRQITLPQPTNQDSVIFHSAVQLFEQIWKTEKKVRLIGVGVSQICTEFQQLSLFDHSFQKEKNLLDAIDDLHQRFGQDSIQKGFKPDDYRSWKE